MTRENSNPNPAFGAHLMAFAGILHIHSTQKDIQKRMDELQQNNNNKQDTITEVEKMLKNILNDIRRDK